MPNVRNSNNELTVYQTDSGALEVRLDAQKDTVWLTQRQLADLFETSTDNISLHLKKIFDDGELNEAATTEESSVVRQEGKRQVQRNLKHYNLDAIISVGYRVSSKRAVQFRQWATRTLRDHLVHGYTLNEERLKSQQENIRQLERTLTLFQRALIDQATLPEARGLARIITDYAQTFVLLNQFDSERLPDEGFQTNLYFEIELDEANQAIAALKKDMLEKGEASELFGRPKDDSFAGILGNITQSFGGEYLYPSVEAQAAHLLYFVIKNHPFTDGNKRIGAFVFIWFLTLNRHHLKQSGDVKINDNALAAIALLVAQSDPKQKELMIHLIMNLIRN